MAELPLQSGLDPERIPLRESCRSCGALDGRLVTRNGQDCVFCLGCDRFQYNAPKTETGRKVRSLQTTHQAIRPKQRARILERATGRCELCGTRGDLAVGHLLSVEAASELGLPDKDINSDENLSAMCHECNAGLGKTPVPLRLAVAIVQARIRFLQQEQS